MAEKRSKRAKPSSGGGSKSSLAGTGNTQTPSPTSKSGLAGTGQTQIKGNVAPPYARTPKGRKAEQARARARESQRRTAKLLRENESPGTARFQAKEGIYPPKHLAKTHPTKYRIAHREASEARHPEGLKEDPLAEFIISTAATAGLGAGAKALGVVGASAAEGLLARGGEKLASKEATVAEGAVEKGARAVAKKLRGAPKAAGKRVKARVSAKAERVRTAPARAKAAPGKAVKAASTKEGRRAAAKGAARSAKAHPVRSGYGAAVVAPEGVIPGEVTKRARAAATGTVNAIINHPGETLKTTARALPAAITAPAALLGAAGTSVLHGTPKPLEETASEQAKGVAQIASDTFSGDPKLAEDAARKEGSLAFLTPLPALTKTKAFERVRGDIRDATGRVRTRLAKTGESANRRVRHGGQDSHVFGLSARHGQRKKTAIIKQRADNPARVSAAHHERQITKAIAKAPKGSDVALQTLAEYGIRDAKGAHLVRQKGPGDKQLIKALDYVDQHPEVFQSKDFKAALAAVDKATKTAPAALVGKGERARLLQQGDILGHVRPEDRLPAAAKDLTHATTRAEAWKELQTSEAKLRELKRRGRAKLEQAKVLKGEERARALQEGKALYAEARKIQARNAKLYKALDPYTRPGQSIDRSARKPYDGKMLDEYKREVEASRKQAGLAPAIYTHHAPANGDKGAGIENRFPTNSSRVEHMREGAYAKGDNLDRSLEGLIRGTVHLPRLRAAGKKFGRDFVKEFQTPFKIDGKTQTVGQGSADWAAITRPKSKDNPNGGQFDPKSWARFPVREWKNAVKDPFTTETDLISILKEAENGQVKGSEPWVLMPREAIKEARAQINPDHNIITQGANAGARVANRLILGTNPAWAIAQTVAEGIPLLMAKPSLLNPVKFASIERDILKFRKQKPEEAMALQATAGASPVGGAALRTPLDQQETYTPALWEKGAKALTRGKTARSVISFAKLRALGEFDVRRQNEYRTLLAAAEADKRFRSWHSSLTGLFDRQASLSKRFKTRDELFTWLTTDPKGKGELKRITDYVDNIQGNWTAFTRYERALAPFTIFYPFLRYSLRWTLWTFPKTHPITATVAYTLGQANANQLEKLVGGPLANPIAYAFPVYKNEKGESAVLPGGSRISPGQSSLTQALQSGNPTAVLSSANPFIGAGLTAVTGIEPFTGQKSSLPSGWAAVNALLSMPAPARIGGVKIGGESPASKAFAQYDPLKAYRSFLFPFLPQSGDKFAAGEKLGKAFSKKYASNAPPSLPAAYWEAAYNHDWKLAKKLRKEVLASEGASELIKSAESPFYTDKNKKFDKEAGEILQFITGKIEVPAPEKKKKSGNPYLEAFEESSGGGNPYLEAVKQSKGGNPYLEALEG